MEDERVTNQSVGSLVKILLDRSLCVEIRDDAAMDLGEFDDIMAFSALVKVAIDTSEDEMLLSSCGDSIADIWRRRGEYELEIFDVLAAPAKQEAQTRVSVLKAV